ncbi:MAG: prephenate dehydratase [Clostridia bacterium]
MMKIGFLGPRGTFSEEALRKYTERLKEYEVCEYTTIPDLIMAVENKEIDEAIAPIENSLEGGVNSTLDLLAAVEDILIKAEVAIDIRENLLAKKGTKTEDIRMILSHPQPIGQCRQYINDNFPDATIKIVYSTAGAAEEVASSKENCAAIGAALAAEVYGLEILAAGIQDGFNNTTRFVVISHNDSGPTGNDKTSIVFSTEDKPGSLYSILDIFNLWDINMTKIESRPAKNQLGRYIFFVDIEGHIEDDNIRDALTMIQRKTSFYRFLGSYPMYVTTE